MKNKIFFKKSKKIFFCRDRYFDPLFLPNPTFPSLIEDIYLDRACQALQNKAHFKYVEDLKFLFAFPLGSLKKTLKKLYKKNI